jgi:poly(3-hydroxybutyrate) depolymerase
MRTILTWVAALVLWSGAAAAAGIVPETFSDGGTDRRFYLYVPDTAKAEGAPLLVLLHGSGGEGSWMIRLWQADADAKGIILVAPNSLHEDGWRIGPDGPAFVCAMADDVAGRYRADRRRIYLFGQSGGAVFALHLALLESRFFAAAAVHAGAFRDDRDFNALPYATRKTPLAIVIGDRDEYFEMSSVTNTQHVLERAGFPISVTIVPGMHHYYTAKVAPGVNATVWDFLKGKALDDAPAYVAYH